MKIKWFRNVKLIFVVLLIVSGGHSLTFGQDQKTLYFNAKYYMAKYDELCSAFDANDGPAFQHLNEYGKKEGRQASPVFDPKFYLNKYADLKNAFGTNYVKAFDHWLKSGVNEGRQGSKEFDARYYLLKNPDVGQVFGAGNFDGAIRHFMQYGIREKRRGSAEVDFANSADAVKRCYGRPFSIIFASDTQYPWVDPSGRQLTESQVQDESERYNKQMVAAMNRIFAEPGTNVRGGIINGDLTAFGHPWQLNKFKEMYGSDKLKFPLFLGLGNHDYANNVDDCYNNRCATGMVDYMIEHIQNNSASSFDYSTSGYRVSGSLAYSWDIGNIHFIQLHNYPAYTRKFTTTFWTYEIKSSMEWLRKDLASAREQQKFIIINMHDATDHFPKEHKAEYDEFVKLVDIYKVSAVFAGHFHHLSGYQKRIGNALLFLSGAASYRTFLLGRFVDGNLYVEFVNAGHTPLRSGNFQVPLRE